ncbi:glycosyltransferase family A protein [Aminobacter sp. HY435]|uniref:glycosyltransferase family A protein n=1 Tax=Aminobacter sp. HY435 TaxID=2970917 RepID=UPI0022B9775A|nr:glycosyltransferase family A protein [Aminobacter sp. HY435]
MKISPKISFVLINYNYGKYVADAIRSIAFQDYGNFECYILDNNSSDDSREIIRNEPSLDDRFHLVFHGENLNQMGAFLSVLDVLDGDLVSIVDSDDVLFKGYASHHAQLHSASHLPVALTSSAVLEIDSEGRPISPGFAPFLRTTPQSEPTSLDFTTAILGQDEQHLLEKQTTFIARATTGWHWSPGTANMYATSVLRKISPRFDGRPYEASTDNYFAPFAHALGGSACIDIPLSAYRIHGNNRHGAIPTFPTLRTTTVSGHNRSIVRRREITLTLVSRADEFMQSHGDTFWTLMDAPAYPDGLGRQAYFTTPAVQQILALHYDRLSDACGRARTEQELSIRMGPKAFRSFAAQLPATAAARQSSQSNRVLARFEL